MKVPRRRFLVAGGGLGVAGLAAALPPPILAAEPANPEEEVTPAEDLMREHARCDASS